jgi:FCD domain
MAVRILDRYLGLSDAAPAVQGLDGHRVARSQGTLTVLRSASRPAKAGFRAGRRTGMIQFERNCGIRILETSARGIGEVFQLRLLLEVPAVRRVTTRMPPALLEDLRAALDSMRGAAGNRRLADYVDSLRDLVLRRGTITVGRSRTAEDIVAEHAAIQVAMERRDAHAAVTMHEHIKHTAELLISQDTGAAEANTRCIARRNVGAVSSVRHVLSRQPFPRRACPGRRARLS